MSGKEGHAPRLFGRGKGHALRPRQQKLVDELLPRLGLPGEITDRAVLANDETPLWLEIGFGSGEHLITQAQRHPDINFIGIEPYLNGMAKALCAVEDHNLGNVRLVRDDARIVLERFPDASLDRVFILFPDPWPKKRHLKRRLISPEFVTELARLIRPGGRLRFASDIAHYQAWALAHILDNGAFAWTAKCADDWRQMAQDHVPTRYEGKARKAGRACVTLDFIRKSCA